ncbi:hypothetical protein GT037_011152 [Alternaria burnsii]|uniref:Uncharacterized protein n=1 Tax=Alternaria burnsii TaxID=1187904 RepID=A0A8H7AUE2_9PLEO|nr:uncharacterized protein GT037_011152 [Alternaria burnsii]KAF7670701.1 hypothetical protein GT037_011152 [Alternaria burnsii]
MLLNSIFHITLASLIFSRDDSCTMTNKTIAAHLLKYRFDQDAVVKLLRGPKALQDKMLASLCSLIREECRRSTTFATAFKGHVVMPCRKPALFDIIGISKEYKLYIPVRKTILALAICRGPLGNRSQLELRLCHHSSSSLDPEESGVECVNDGKHQSHQFPRPE